MFYCQLPTSNVWEVGVDIRLCLCVNCLDTSTNNSNVRLNDAMFLQQVFYAHQVFAVLLRLQVHLPRTATPLYKFSYTSNALF